MDCELKLIWNSSKTFLNERVLRSCLPPLGGTSLLNFFAQQRETWLESPWGVQGGDMKGSQERSEQRDIKMANQITKIWRACVSLCRALDLFEDRSLSKIFKHPEASQNTWVYSLLFKETPKIGKIGFIFGAGLSRSWFGKASIAWRRRGCNYGGSTVWPHTKTRVSRLHCRDIIHSHTKTRVSRLNCIVSFRALHRVYFTKVTWIVLYMLYWKGITHKDCPHCT